jgi:hypothetical protein
MSPSTQSCLTASALALLGCTGPLRALAPVASDTAARRVAVESSVKGPPASQQVFSPNLAALVGPSPSASVAVAMPASRLEARLASGAERAPGLDASALLTVEVDQEVRALVAQLHRTARPCGTPGLWCLYLRGLERTANRPEFVASNTSSF